MSSGQQQPSGSPSQSPRQPPSPTLKPRAHREDPSSSSMSSSSSSSSLHRPTGAAGASTSSPASSSSSSSDGDPHSTDAMSSSIISTLDLDGEDEREGSSDDTRHAERIPLVREDTATKAAMQGMGYETDTETDDTSIEQHNTPSAKTHDLPDTDSDADTDTDTDTAPHQPKTTATKPNQPETIPTVSATGMPRFLPRSLDDPTKQAKIGSTGPPPPELQPQATAGAPTASRQVPTGSLTLAALMPSSQMSLRRRLGIISASLFVNLGLPFVNGVMLGFGEIFARSLIAPVVIGTVYTWWPGLRAGGSRAGDGFHSTA